MGIEATPGEKFRIIREMTSHDNNLLNLSWLCKIAGVSVLVIIGGFPPRKPDDNAKKLINQILT